MDLSEQALSEIDLRILAVLQRNGRVTNAQLAELVGVSASPCWRHVQAMERSGVITGYVALVAPVKIGLPVSIFVRVSLASQNESSIAAFEAAIAARPEVMECYLMTGDMDYFLRVVAADLVAYEHFLMAHLTRVPGISSIRSSFALRTVKYRTDLPLEQLETPASREHRRKIKGKGKKHKS